MERPARGARIPRWDHAGHDVPDQQYGNIARRGLAAAHRGRLPFHATAHDRFLLAPALLRTRHACRSSQRLGPSVREARIGFSAASHFHLPTGQVDASAPCYALLPQSPGGPDFLWRILILISPPSPSWSYCVTRSTSPACPSATVARACSYTNRPARAGSIS